MRRRGSWKVGALEVGFFGLDGGAMFGVVPRVQWSRRFPPDESGRIRLLSRCLVLQHDEGRVVIVDSGMGARWTQRARETFAVDEQASGGLVDRLAERGIAREAVTDVIATHLHFDHAGGLVEGGGSALRPVFPGARVHVQAEHLEWAKNPSLRDRASFRAADFAPLEEAGLLEVHEGACELQKGLTIRISHGHTPAMQMPLLDPNDGGPQVFFPSDLIPTTAHVPLPWVMAYDNRPLLTVEEKGALLGEASESGWSIVSDHDPEVEAFTVRRSKASKFKFDYEPVEL